MRFNVVMILLSNLAISANVHAQGALTDNVSDTLLFSGQISIWSNYNYSNELPLWFGARYIPQLNYHIKLPDTKLIDFEASANISGSAGLLLFDSSHSDGNIRPYRAWARYSSEQFELRAGLQKINFGSAAILRPLMWFEQVDPRDPLRITTGVWGLLGRYYFLNNANIWLWGLYGNKEPKTWETGTTSQKYPEFGGRFQTPVPGGEAGISFHHRQVDTLGFEVTNTSSDAFAENRFAFDAKWDVRAGLWFEGAWINKSEGIGLFTNQVILNAGSDYTFGIGNGLNLIFEQLVIAYDQKPFAFIDPVFFSALSLSYPLGLFDNVSAIMYYNWSTDQSYNLINWNRKFNKLHAYLIAYWNPETYSLPQQLDAGNLFSGKGIQVMVVYNH
ncbi:MAG: hypothetical protein WEB30_19040 [Cyclobacteriaceae bacterium]